MGLGPSLEHAQVAQLVEHATENRSVGGSIPPLGTISFPKRLDRRLSWADAARIPNGLSEREQRLLPETCPLSAGAGASLTFERHVGWRIPKTSDYAPR